MAKEFLVNCLYCGKYRVIREPSAIADLTQVTLSRIPGGVPILDPETSKVKNKKTIPRRPMYKCPKCGRGVVLKVYMVPTPTKENDGEKEDNSTGRETSTT